MISNDHILMKPSIDELSTRFELNGFRMSLVIAFEWLENVCMSTPCSDHTLISVSKLPVNTYLAVDE